MTPSLCIHHPAHELTNFFGKSLRIVFQSEIHPALIGRQILMSDSRGS
jgi:serine acetyltransferase